MTEARFAIGQIVVHALYGYRGVIVDADASFALSDNWYQRMAKTKPAKEQPWYHILVNDSDMQTYVAEGNLVADNSPQEIEHPLLTDFFHGFQQGGYLSTDPIN